eukprot:gene9976-20744_t
MIASSLRVSSLNENKNLNSTAHINDKLVTMELEWNGSQDQSDDTILNLKNEAMELKLEMIDTKEKDFEDKSHIYRLSDSSGDKSKTSTTEIEGRVKVSLAPEVVEKAPIIASPFPQLLHERSPPPQSLNEPSLPTQPSPSPQARITAEEAEKSRLTAEEAEKSRITAEEAEKSRITAEEAEKSRITAEETEKSRLTLLEVKAKLAEEAWQVASQAILKAEATIASTMEVLARVKAEDEARLHVSKFLSEVTSDNSVLKGLSKDESLLVNGKEDQIASSIPPMIISSDTEVRLLGVHFLVLFLVIIGWMFFASANSTDSVPDVDEKAELFDSSGRDSMKGNIQVNMNVINPYKCPQ